MIGDMSGHYGFVSLGDDNGYSLCDNLGALCWPVITTSKKLPPPPRTTNTSRH